MKSWHVILGLGLAAGAGCGAGMKPAADAPAQKSAAATGETLAKAENNQKPGNVGAPVGDPGPAGGAPAPEQPRKIIYNAQISVVVEEFDHGAAELLQVVKAQKAYIAKSDMGGSPGARRFGTWTVRVPVDNYQAFLDAAAKIGELERLNTDSEDITDRYSDLEIRVQNMKARETRLRAYLEEKKLTTKLEDIFAVERELNRVRDEIDHAQGTLQKWDKLSTLATVVVSIQERRTYIPTAPTVASFSTTIGRTFGRSLDLLIDLGKTLVLIAVALAPWVPVLAVIGLIGWLVGRRGWRNRRLRGQPISVEAMPPTQPG